MWDSRYIPTVECSGEHPDSQSCPYGGMSTPQPSSPSPSSTPSPSPKPIPTSLVEGKKGSKARDIFTFRKHTWAGSQQDFVLEESSDLSVHCYCFLRLGMIFHTWTNPVVHCETVPFFNHSVTSDIWLNLSRGSRWEAVFFFLRAEQTITGRRGASSGFSSAAGLAGIPAWALWAGVTQGSQAASSTPKPRVKRN